MKKIRTAVHPVVGGAVRSGGPPINVPGAILSLRVGGVWVVVVDRAVVPRDNVFGYSDTSGEQVWRIAPFPGAPSDQGAYADMFELEGQAGLVYLYDPAGIMVGVDPRTGAIRDRNLDKGWD